MEACDHEEANTRIHAKHQLTNGLTSITFICSDIVVIIILLGIFHKLAPEHSITDMTVEFSKKELTRMSIKNLATSLGQSPCKSLGFLHALTGCNTLSAFRGIGKKKACIML